MFLDKAPVDLNTQTRQAVQMDHAMTHGGTLSVQMVLDRMALGVSVRFHSKGIGAERRDQVAMYMGGSMGRNDHAVLCCQRGNT